MAALPEAEAVSKQGGGAAGKLKRSLTMALHLTEISHLPKGVL